MIRKTYVLKFALAIITIVFRAPVLRIREIVSLFAVFGEYYILKSFLLFFSFAVAADDLCC